ncbi:Metallo-dependent phosphatase [Gigaspora margarita]|uniref:Metallo-dependent phosphatase n=1 Tax=Gigaspora margarita TaxID=4874 RepID=A0A8H3WXM7_GIGMA|nr:Metallo-dependent phosphatase [Gigaspora margarita]
MSPITQKKRITEKTYNIKPVAIIITIISVILVTISLSMIPYVPVDIKSDFYMESHFKHLNTSKILIANLSSSVSSKNLIFIGDVHGSFDELEMLLKKINYNSTNDHLIFVGDLVAKGPESLEVVKLVKKYESSCVRGNHDDKVIGWKALLNLLARKGIKLKDYVKKNELPPHLSMGTEHLNLARNIDTELFEFLSSCPIVLNIPEQDIYVVHAGLLPDIPIDQQDPYDIMTMRNIKNNGKPSKSLKKGHSWSRFWNNAQKSSPTPKTVIYGHDASRGLNIKEFSFGLDSRCVYGGELTALKWNEGKSIHSVSCGKYTD